MSAPDQLCASAASALAGGEYQRAIQLCMQALDLAPQHHEATRLLQRATLGLVDEPSWAGDDSPPQHAAVDPRTGRPLTPLERAARVRLERQEQIDGWYTAGKAALQRREWAIAATLLQRVAAAPPRYRRDATVLLAEVRHHLARTELQPRPSERSLSSAAHSGTGSGAGADNAAHPGRGT